MPTSAGGGAGEGGRGEGGDGGGESANAQADQVMRLEGHTDVVRICYTKLAAESHLPPLSWGMRSLRPGAWWVLNHAIRLADTQILGVLCSIPTRIEALSLESPDSAAVFQEWYQDSWVHAMISMGLIDLALDIDDLQHCAAAAEGGKGGGVGADGPMFPHIYKAVIRVYNKARQLKLAGFASGSFLRPLLQVWCIVLQYVVLCCIRV